MLGKTILQERSLLLMQEKQVLGLEMVVGEETRL
jgi:hypothetical protein